MVRRHGPSQLARNPWSPAFSRPPIAAIVHLYCLRLRRTHECRLGRRRRADRPRAHGPRRECRRTHAEFAESGDEAVRKAKTLRPALILLDVVMPGTDGFAACRALHKDPDTSSIPVVLVTQKATEADQF